MNDENKKKKKDEEVEETEETKATEESEEKGNNNDEIDTEIEETEDGRDAQIGKLTEEVAQEKQRYLRVLADYQNLEKRVQEQRKELFATASREILLRILPILDTLQLAKKHSDDSAIAATIGQFLAILSSEGVTQLETVGKEFDPGTMECVTTGAGEENRVLEEIRAGYMLGDKLLRTAQVIVGNGEEKN